MTDSNDKVLEAKNALMVALGDNAQKYLNNMKFWFRFKWTKEEFDIECRKLLTPAKMHLHNTFLTAILNKIDTYSIPQQIDSLGNHHSSSLHSGGGNRNGGSSSRKRKRSSKISAERSIFEPTDTFEYIQEENLDHKRPSNNSFKGNLPPQQKFCVQELFLPDAGFIMGRLLVGAWESGLLDVDDHAAEYLASAVQTLLKNIISIIVTKRNHFRLAGGGEFYYDIGCPIKDPTIRNTVTRRKIDDMPMEIDKEISSISMMRKCSDETVFLSSCEDLYPQRRKLITLKDVYKALQDKNSIQSHTVYSVNMERLIQMLH